MSAAHPAPRPRPWTARPVMYVPGTTCRVSLSRPGHQAAAQLPQMSFRAYDCPPDPQPRGPRRQGCPPCGIGPCTQDKHLRGAGEDRRPGPWGHRLGWPQLPPAWEGGDGLDVLDAQPPGLRTTAHSRVSPARANRQSGARSPPAMAHSQSVRGRRSSMFQGSEGSAGRAAGSGPEQGPACPPKHELQGWATP